MLGPWFVGRLGVAILFEPRDAWIGVYVDPQTESIFDRYVAVYLCMLPFVPIRVTWQLRPRRG